MLAQPCAPPSTALLMWTQHTSWSPHPESCDPPPKAQVVGSRVLPCSLPELPPEESTWQLEAMSPHRPTLAVLTHGGPPGLLFSEQGWKSSFR